LVVHGLASAPPRGRDRAVWWDSPTALGFQTIEIARQTTKSGVDVHLRRTYVECDHAVKGSLP